MKLFSFIIILVTILLSGCSTTRNKSVVITPLQEPIKEILIIVEQPMYAPDPNKKHHREKTEVAKYVSIINYNNIFPTKVKTDFVKVMQDNGIESKLYLVPPSSEASFNNIPQDQAKKWSHAMLIRHLGGITKCKYNRCRADYLSTAQIYDTDTGKTIWKSHVENGGAWYSRRSWELGHPYRDLLKKLDKDKLIQLPGNTPIINL
jgi:hypothetical protein